MARFLAGAALTVSLSSGLTPHASAQTAANNKWVATWTTAMQGTLPTTQTPVPVAGTAANYVPFAFPQAATVRFHLGLLLLWSGQVKEARRQLRLVRAAESDSPLVRVAKQYLDQLTAAGI